MRMADLAGAERLLRHPVAALLTAPEGAVTVAASIGGDPPCTRLAWIDWRAGAIVARIACPPGPPEPPAAVGGHRRRGGAGGRRRPGPRDQGGRPASPASRSPSPTPSSRPRSRSVPSRSRSCGSPRDLAVVMVDALDAGGEPLGRLDAAGIGVLHLSSGRLAGRLGARHGMAAGFGAGRWTDDLEDAAFEGGFPPAAPGVAPGGPRARAVPPRAGRRLSGGAAAVAVAWGREPRRVLVRQTPGPLPNPDTPGGRTEPVAIGSGKDSP